MGVLHTSDIKEGKGYCRCLPYLNCEVDAQDTQIEMQSSCCDDSHVLGSVNKPNDYFEELPMNKLRKVAIETSTQL